VAKLRIGALGGKVKQIAAICILALFYLVPPSPSDAEMLGPYSGTVIDSSTGKPIEGASVLIYWKKIIRQPIEATSDLIDAKLTYTNAAGEYALSTKYAITGLNGYLESTHVIIYAPGYQVYIKEIYHNSPYAKPDPDFQNSKNTVKLERIPPDFDHKAHYDRIEHALWGLERYDYSAEKNVSWNEILKSGLRRPFEREQFLRRVEWEQRRPGLEGK
jgi:hypothetical protein